MLIAGMIIMFFPALLHPSLLQKEEKIIFKIFHKNETKHKVHKCTCVRTQAPPQAQGVATPPPKCKEPSSS